MGRRSRKRISDAERSTAGTPPAEPERGPTSARTQGGRAGPPRTPRRRSSRQEAPAAPWSPFPLVELCILLGLILFVVGILTHGSRGHVILAAGLVLVALSTLELSVREHFAGYRSHTSLLAGACTVAGETALFFALRPAPPLLAVIALAIFAVTWPLLRGAFRRRSGGLGWRA